MKKILSVFVSLLIVFFSSIVVCEADEEQDSNSDVNYFTFTMFEQFLGHYDFSSCDFTAFQNFTDYSVMSFSYKNNDDSQYYDGPCYGMSVNALSIDATDYDLTFDRGSVFLAANCTKFYGFKPDEKSIIPYYSSDILSSVNFSIWSCDRDFVIVNDLNIYNKIYSLIQEGIAQGYDVSADNLYYCRDPKKAFTDYLGITQSYYFCNKADGYESMLRYYDCFDSPAGRNDKVYQDEYENWVSASVSFNDNVFFTSTKISDSDSDIGFMHNEVFKFYLIPDFDTMNLLSEHENDKEKVTTIINDYLNKNVLVTHYYDGRVDFTDWYYDKVVPSLPSSYSNKSLGTTVFYDIKPSTDEKVTINYLDSISDVYVISFYMPDTYSYLDSQEGSSILTGYHTQHWFPELNLSNGSVIINSGFGSDISNADFADHPDREALLQQGWQSGYPNNSGNFPYKITCNVNGEPYLYFYFSKMPNVVSTYYSDSMFRYTVDFYDLDGYIYDPVADCSISFDFTNLSTKLTDDFETDDYWEIGGVLKVRDPVDAITDFLGSSSVEFCNGYLSATMGINYTDFAENFKMYLWTNYTGSVLANKYKGYYVQFNWNLDEADNFIKDNSSDDYDYSKDYLPDDGFKDNNGNTHGGGIITDTSVGVGGSGSTDSNVTEFEFNEVTLWEYANSFLKFAAAAFTILPAWMWTLIATSITILIVLRIMGR